MIIDDFESQNSIKFQMRFEFWLYWHLHPPSLVTWPSICGISFLRVCLGSRSCLKKQWRSWCRKKLWKAAVEAILFFFFLKKSHCSFLTATIGSQLRSQKAAESSYVKRHSGALPHRTIALNTTLGSVIATVPPSWERERDFFLIFSFLLSFKNSNNN